jgi:hypothetical protein
MPIPETMASQASAEEYGDLLLGLNEDDMNDFDGLDDFGDDDQVLSMPDKSAMCESREHPYASKLNFVSTPRCRPLCDQRHPTACWLHDREGKTRCTPFGRRSPKGTENVPGSRTGARYHRIGSEPKQRYTEQAPEDCRRERRA